MRCAGLGQKFTRQPADNCRARSGQLDWRLERLSWSGLEMTGGGRDGGSIFVTAQDGLRLHVQEYGSRIAPGVPVVCLPGLTRSGSDFAALAQALANDM